MFYSTITNPKTNRTNSVKCWEIQPREAIAKLTTVGAKAYSWELLSEPEAVAEMESTSDGDSARSNFALSVLENALDWGLGLAVLHFIRASVQNKKMPKPFTLAVNSRGDIFVITGGSKTVIPM